MRKGTPLIVSLGRSLTMLEAILADREGRSVTAIARETGLPVATAHRQVATLVDGKFLARLPGQRLGPGLRLLTLLRTLDEKGTIAATAAPVLRRVAERTRAVCWLGTFENDMVTYRVKAGRGPGDAFARVGAQLEAYCTGVGKVLLAHLSARDQETYLSTGPFPALTSNTITDPEILDAELASVRARGFALDQEEFAIGLTCCAVPIRDMHGRVSSAISMSQEATGPRRRDDLEVLELLKEAVDEIQESLNT